MRLISQDGSIDLPYEQVVVTINADDKKTIIACPVNVADETYWNMAKYSTKAKAAKAMEMLRTEYDTPSSGGDYLMVWQFPKDSLVDSEVDRVPCTLCNIKKNMVTSLEIIVSVIENKPYYEIKYKRIGEDDYHIGYSSYDLSIVLGYRDEYFELVTK